MKRTLFVALFAPLLMLAEAPHMQSVTPKTAKPGDVLEVTGTGLKQPQVEEVYLTDHKFDLKVKVLEQTGKMLKFRIPPFAKPGRMQLMILTGGDEPKLLEQPLYILIEEKATEISAVK